MESPVDALARDSARARPLAKSVLDSVAKSVARSGEPARRAGRAAPSARVWDEAEAGACGPALAVLDRAADLAGSRGALRLAFATLSDRLVTRQSWKRLGYARLGDYGRERLGHSARSLYDLARGHTKLAALPQVREALLHGGLPWTKARLLCRVATPADEATWLVRAGRLSTDALEKEVRVVDRGSLEAGAGLEAVEDLDADGYPVAPRETFVLRKCSIVVQAKWHRARQWANRVEGRICSPPEVLERVVAEVLSSIPLEESVPEAPVRGGLANTAAGRETGSPTVAPTPFRGPPVAPDVEPLLAGLECVDAFELDRRLRTLVVLEQRLDARIGELLREVERGRLHRLLGCPSLARFAQEFLAMAPSKARALLRLERAGEVCPELRRAYRGGRLSWVQAQILLPLLTLAAGRRFRARWIRRARGVTVRRLEGDVAGSLLLHSADPHGWQRTGGLPSAARCRREATRGDESQIRAEPTRAEATYSRVESCRLLVNAPLEVTRLARALLATARRRLERLLGRPVGEGEAFEAMLDHALEAWAHPSCERRRDYRIFRRDGWRCAMPGCSSYRNLHTHHIRYRSHKGGDEDENLVTLCAFHHLRGEHAAVLRIRGRAPAELRFELGLRSEGPPLVTYASGDRLVSAAW